MELLELLKRENFMRYLEELRPGNTVGYWNAQYCPIAKFLQLNGIEARVDYEKSSRKVRIRDGNIHDSVHILLDNDDVPEWIKVFVEKVGEIADPAITAQQALLILKGILRTEILNLLKKESFVWYLEGFDSDCTVGYADNPGLCPIANYLQINGIERARVDYDKSARNTRINLRYSQEALLDIDDVPEWVKVFVDKVDDNANPEITALLALLILDEIRS